MIKLDIQNFRGIKSQKVDIVEGFNVITGKNESGKSNILVAICKLLFDTTFSEGLKNLPKSELFHRDCKNYSIKMNFDDLAFEEKASLTSADLKIGDLKGSRKEIRKQWNKKLGIVGTPKQIKNYIFSNIVITPDSPSLVKSTPEELNRSLSVIFGLESIDSAIERCKEKLTKINNQLSEKLNILDSLESYSEKYSFDPVRYKKLKDSLDFNLLPVTRISQDIEQLVNRIKNIKIDEIKSPVVINVEDLYFLEKELKDMKRCKLLVCPDCSNSLFLDNEGLKHFDKEVYESYKKELEGKLEITQKKFDKWNIWKKNEDRKKEKSELKIRKEKLQEQLTYLNENADKFTEFEKLKVFKSLHQNNEKIISLKKEIKSLKSEEADYNFIQRTALKEIRSAVLKNRTDVLTTYINEIYTQLGCEGKIKFLDNGTNLGIFIENNGRDANYFGLSKSTRALVSLSVSIGMTLVKKTDLDLIIIDDLVDSSGLDIDRKRKLVSVIKDLARRFKYVILAIADDSIITEYDNLIEVKK